MARLPCSVTFDLKTMIDEGNEHKARELAVQRLREGFASPEFLALVADMLSPAERGKGRPKRAPRRWYEIGQAFEDLRDHGRTYEAACSALADQFGASQKTIERTVAHYRDIIESVRENQAEIDRENAAHVSSDRSPKSALTPR